MYTFFKIFKPYALFFQGRNRAYAMVGEAQRWYNQSPAYWATPPFAQHLNFGIGSGEDSAECKILNDKHRLKASSMSLLYIISLSSRSQSSFDCLKNLKNKVMNKRILHYRNKIKSLARHSHVCCPWNMSEGSLARPEQTHLGQKNQQTFCDSITLNLSEYSQQSWRCACSSSQYYRPLHCSPI